MQLSHIIAPDGKAPTKASPATVTSTAEIVIGFNKKFMISALSAAFAAVAFQVAFGRSGMAAADATSFAFPPGGPYVLQSPSAAWDRIRVFNPTAATIDVYVSPLFNS